VGTLRISFGLSLTLLVLLVAFPVSAQTSGTDRLFMGFDEEAAVVDSQWWEGQGEIAEGSDFDAVIARPVAAFQLREAVEIGGRVGFGRTDSSPGTPDGTGATDLDLWGKYHFGVQGDAEWAIGGTATVPTGDDTAGLGFDAFSLGGFGSMRYRLSQGFISASVGVRLNGDGQFRGPGTELEGKTSVTGNVGWLYPISDTVTFVAEADAESRRFERNGSVPGVGTVVRVLGGINLRVANRGMVRVAIVGGLTDDAPDLQILGGYAFHF